MKINKFLVMGIFLLLGAGIVAGAFSLAISGDSSLDLAKADKDTLATKGVTNPTISELECDGTNCRACANDNGYGMGCISIAQKYCSGYVEVEITPEQCEVVEGIEVCHPAQTETQCSGWVDYTNAELKTNRDEAFKVRWENIADAIRQRDAKTNEIPVDAGEITINEKK